MGYTTGFYDGQRAERERIIKLLEGIDYLSDCCFQPDCCVTTGELIALIKGEKKGNLWTSRPLTEEDKEHYGLEGENK
jgi:hypothetical protein